MQKKSARRGVGFAGFAVSFGMVAAGVTAVGVTAERLHAAAPTDKPTRTPSGKATAAASDAPLTEDQRIVHVLNRLGFGPRPGDIERVRAMGLSQYIDAQLHPETVDDSVIDKKLTSFPLLTLSGDDLSRLYFERQKNQRKVREQLQMMQGAEKAETPAGAGAMAAGGQDAMMSPAGAPAMTANSAADDAQKLRAKVMANATPEQREQMRAMYLTVAKSAQAVSDVEMQTTVAKTMRAIESERQLQEVLVDFWGNHFNIDISKQQCATLKTADDRDVIRTHALGKFRDLLSASAKSPAMLVYLDNYQSTSPHGPGAGAGTNGPNAARMAALAANPNLNPQQRRRLAAFQERMKAQAALPAKGKKQAGGLNENYGREIMELHTLGVDGGYTQKDVTEVARCFTGWSLERISADGADPRRKYELGGTFHFYPALHDDGEKTVLGHVIPPGGGMSDGEKVLDILASNPATMRHISTELCQRLVSDTPPSTLVDKCVATWQKTDGDIREIVRTIVTSPEFYSRAAYEKKIKSPFEYAVSSVRALGGTCDVSAATLRPAQRKVKKDGTGLYGAQTLLGQITAMGEPVFRYQAPTGYPEDSHKWVSAGALISRLNFSLALANGKLMAVQLPDLDGEVAGLTGPAQIVDRLSNNLLHAPVSASTRNTLLAQVSGGESAGGDAHAAASDLSLTRRLTALLLGSPEFQRR